MTFDDRWFEPDPRNVLGARRFVADVLSAAPISATIREWAALVTSELATNAVVHAGTDFRVRVRADQAVEIAVTDRGSADPVVVEPDPERYGGRGMFIVASGSDDWGVDHTPDGKRVWCSKSL